MKNLSPVCRIRKYTELTADLFRFLEKTLKVYKRARQANLTFFRYNYYTASVIRAYHSHQAGTPVISNTKHYSTAKKWPVVMERLFDVTCVIVLCEFWSHDFINAAQ